MAYQGDDQYLVWEDDQLENTFVELASRAQQGNNVIVWEGVNKKELKAYPSYGFADDNDIRIEKLGIVKGYNKARVHGLTEEPLMLEVPIPGDHNLLNSVLAASLCLKAGCSKEEVENALASFAGVQRRFEYVIKNDHCTFIDDYAHHPKEIDALISAVRELYPDKKITGVFQPHLYSRTRDFADEFANSLSALDELILLPIYPAREKPIKGVDAKMLLEKVRLNEKSIVNKENLPLLISSRNPEILLTIGAGDISQLLPAVKQALIAKN